jgi:hypothetical protein
VLASSGCTRGAVSAGRAGIARVDDLFNSAGFAADSPSMGVSPEGGAAGKAWGARAPADFRDQHLMLRS